MKTKRFTFLELIVVVLIIVATHSTIARGAWIIMAGDAELRPDKQTVSDIIVKDPNIAAILLKGEMEGYEYKLSFTCKGLCKLELKKPNRTSFEILDIDGTGIVGDNKLEGDYFKISTEHFEIVFKNGNMMEWATDVLHDWITKIMKRYLPEALCECGYSAPWVNSQFRDINDVNLGE